jgi:hypothetical protein
MLVVILWLGLFIVVFLVMLNGFLMAANGTRLTLC